jgi:hypothetical protein
VEPQPFLKAKYTITEAHPIIGEYSAIAVSEIVIP